MRITLGANKEDNFPLAAETHWGDFVAMLKDMSAQPICGADKNECKAKAMALTACTFAGDGRRIAENARNASFVWLDCEGGNPHELSIAAQALAEMQMEAVVYTTASHTPPYDRFRVIIPLASPIGSNQDYRRVCLLLAEKLGVAIDRSKLTMYSLLYQPATYSSASENLFLHLTGATLTADQWLSLCPPPPPTPAPIPMVPIAQAGVGSAYLTAAINGEVAKIASAGAGTRHNTVRAAAVSLAGLAKSGLLDWAEVKNILR